MISQLCWGGFLCSVCYSWHSKSVFAFKSSAFKVGLSHSLPWEVCLYKSSSNYKAWFGRLWGTPRNIQTCLTYHDKMSHRTQTHVFVKVWLPLCQFILISKPSPLTHFWPAAQTPKLTDYKFWFITQHCIFFKKAILILKCNLSFVKIWQQHECKAKRKWSDHIKLIMWW